MNEDPQLWKYVYRSSYKTIVKRVASNPNEACYIDVNGDTALHHLVQHRLKKRKQSQSHPIEAIKAVYSAFPEAAKLRNRKGGSTPLHIASYCASTEVVTYLLQVFPGAAVMGDNIGRTPLHCACYSRNDNVRKVMIIARSCPESVNIENNEKVTPLIDLTFRHTSHIENILCSKDVHIIDTLRYATTVSQEFSFPLLDYWLMAKCMIETVKFGKFTGNLQSNMSWNIVHYCLGMKHFPSRLLRLILKIYEDQIGKIDQNGYHALHIAAANPTITGLDAENIISELINAYPPATEALCGTRSCLALAIDKDYGKKCWNSGVKNIYSAYSIAAIEKDVFTGMFPFMLAAASPLCDISTVYRLFRFCPEMDRFVNTEG
mmetsp:Transcript_19279/g.23717  ORF Transcript_19279/g.23717 Transcript_19279/m.23717 type:complete len:376 (-) Transcript_19279:30-1157(-)